MFFVPSQSRVSDKGQRTATLAGALLTFEEYFAELLPEQILSGSQINCILGKINIKMHAIYKLKNKHLAIFV